MSPSNRVADYLDALARELAFDPPLSRRVRHEVQDHLWEAIMSDPTASAPEAEQRAISRFGKPYDIAAQYRAASLYLRMRRTGAFVIFAIAGVFVAMKGRVAWYGMMNWESSARLKAISSIVLPIDRYAFLFGATLAIFGWLYMLTRSIPTSYHRTCRAQLRRCQFITGSAAAAVGIAVSSEVLLTVLRLTETPWSPAVLFPTASIMTELVLIVSITAYIRNTIRRVALGEATLSN